jgi:PAS domain S-box-containing protein
VFKIKKYKGVFAAARDVTERKKNEEAKFRLSQRNELILNSAGEGMYGTDTDGNITFINPAGAKMLEYSAAELLGKSSHAMFHHTRADGIPYPIEECPLQLCLKQGSVYRPIEDVFWTKYGKRLEIEFTNSPSIERGKITGVVVVFHDISERKYMEEELKKHRDHLQELVAERTRELREAQEGLIRAERLATLGQFSGSISHELRNPLGVIDSSIYYLKTKLKDADGKVHEHLDRIKSSVSNSTAIIESLLNLTRMKTPELVKLDLAAVTRDAVATSKLPETIVAKLEFPEEEILANGDHELLRMAFKNIIKNANEAMEGRGTLTVKIRKPAAGWSEISFADTGPGIAAEDLEKVFQPLFSRKAKGIGFGLAICRMVIDKHGGTIEARAEPGKGATIVIRLPLYAGKEKEA